jgi:hypothetical protein
MACSSSACRDGSWTEAALGAWRRTMRNPASNGKRANASRAALTMMPFVPTRRTRSERGLV